MGIALWPTLCPANYFGLPNARNYSAWGDQKLSIEVGYAKGQFFTLDYEHSGVRFTYPSTQRVLLELNLGESTLDRASGTSYGIGVIYRSDLKLAQLPPANFKLSYHTVSAERPGFIDYEPDIISVQALVGDGSDLLGYEGLGWYFNTGIHRFADRVGSESEFGVGGGLLLALFSGELYAGVDLIDNVQVGAGIRITLF